MRYYFAILLCLALSLSSCSRKELPPLARENLFHLSIGRLEDQVDLFSIENRGELGKVRIAMQDGILYVVDGNSGKVQRFSSYGDLLMMIYNPEKNPPPLTLKTEFDAGDILTRKAIAYPLESPGEISVDSRKHVYVEDRLPEYRHQLNLERTQMLERVVLHFDNNSNFIDYLGQEGPGGNPFPYIDGLYHSVRDELAVVCKTLDGYVVYWFDREGNPLFVIYLNKEDVPRLKEGPVPSSLESIKVAPDERLIYLKVDNYKNTIDPASGTVTGIDLENSMLWTMDIEDGSYIDNIIIPEYEYRFDDNTGVDSYRGIYSLLGAGNGGKVYFMAPQHAGPPRNGYNLFILDRHTNSRKYGFIPVEDEEQYFSCFNLSPAGIVTALLASEYELRVVWWRASGLLGESAY